MNPRYHLQKDAEKGKYEKETGIPIDKEKKTVTKPPTTVKDTKEKIKEFDDKEGPRSQ